MLGVRQKRAARWLVPVGVVALLAVGATVTAGSAGAASPDLPQKSAAQLLAADAQATPHPFSGTATETADLGLPALPGGSSTSLQWQSLIAGTHTAKVWVASPQQVRLALVGDLAESDVVRNGPDVWIWQSGANTVDHVVVPSRAAGSTPSTLPSEMPTITPDSAAATVLAALDPTTTVTVDRTAYVAGRPVYELVLVPKQTGSLVSSVRIAIDSVTSMPLGVWIYAVGQDAPAFESSFTSITFATPDASVFAFTPPAGATVTEHALTSDTGKPGSTVGTPTTPGVAPTAAQRPSIIGHGWTAVVKASGLTALLGGPSQGSATSGWAGGSSTASLGVLLSGATPVSGSYGSGRVIQTSLITILILDNGTVFAGAVTPTVLEQAASSAR